MGRVVPNGEVGDSVRALGSESTWRAYGERMNSARPRPRRSRGVAIGVAAAATVALTGCGLLSDVGQPIDAGASGGEGAATSADEGGRPNPTPPESAELKKIGASTFLNANQPGVHSFRTDNGRTCMFTENEATCTGTVPADAPAAASSDATNAAKVSPKGSQYATFEGNNLNPGTLHAAEYVEHGRVTCSHIDADTVSCSVGDDGFTLTGPDGDIALEGTVISDSGADSGSGPSYSSEDFADSSDSGASGYITRVPTSSGVVRASTPACDSRGILILESVVVQPGADAEEAIATSLAKHPRSEFTTPGACPSLRAQLNGADIYAVYFDYGKGFGRLCSAATNTGGNARVLSNRHEYVSPC